MAKPVNHESKSIAACRVVIDTIHSVENRCMAADGPVTPTHQEITDDELRAMYVACREALGEMVAQ
jgi:hypothetical protein